MKKNNLCLPQILLVGLISSSLMTIILFIRLVTSESFHLLYSNYEKFIFGLLPPLVNGLGFLIPNIIGGLLCCYLIRFENKILINFLKVIFSASIVFGFYMLIKSIPIMLIGYEKGPIMLKELIPYAAVNSVVFLLVFLAVKSLYSKAKANKIT